MFTVNFLGSSLSATSCLSQLQINQSILTKVSLLKGFADFLPYRFFTHSHATLKFEFVAGARRSGIMASCERSRSSAYGEHLRWRIVWQKEGLGLSDDTIASNLNIRQVYRVKNDAKVYYYRNSS